METKHEIKERKALSRLPLKPLNPREGLELDTEDTYPSDVFLGVPQRPPWEYSMEKV